MPPSKQAQIEPSGHLDIVADGVDAISRIASSEPGSTDFGPDAGVNPRSEVINSFEVSGDPGKLKTEISLIIKIHLPQMDTSVNMEITSVEIHDGISIQETVVRIGHRRKERLDRRHDVIGAVERSARINKSVPDERDSSINLELHL